MRKWMFALIICMIVPQLWAQGNYYIYIQSEDNKPFYVKMGNKVLESSGNGYLVITGLQGSTSEFLVGFPEKAGVEWKFNCTTSESDQAYILKNSNSKTVELNVLNQSKNIAGVKIETSPTKQPANQEKKLTGVVSDDLFSTMLSQVVNDPSIRQQPVIIPKPGDSLNLAKTLKKDSAIAAVVVDNKIKKDTVAVAAKTLKDTVNALVTSVEKKPEVKRDSIATATKTLKDTVTALVASVEKKPEIKKEEKQPSKVDSSTFAQADKKDSTNALVSSAKKEEKSIVKIDSSAIVKAGKKDSTSFVTTIDKKPEPKKEENIGSKVDNNSLKADSAAFATVTDKKPALTKEDKPVVKADSSMFTKTTKQDSSSIPVVTTDKPSEQKKEDKPIAITDNKPEIKKEEKPLVNTVKPDSTALAKTTPVTKPENNTAKVDTPPPTNTATGVWVPVEKKLSSVVRSSNIKRTLQRKSNDGIELIYIDELSDGSKETIRILIPAN